MFSPPDPPLTPLVCAAAARVPSSPSSAVVSTSNALRAPPPSTFTLGIVGAVASVLAHAILYPLDILRTAVQLDRSTQSIFSHSHLQRILNHDGFAGLYRGIVPVLTTCGLSQFLYVWIMEAVKRLGWGRVLLGVVRRGGSSTSSALESFLASLVAGVLNMALTEPLWKANVFCMAAKRKALQSSLEQNAARRGDPPSEEEEEDPMLRSAVLVEDPGKAVVEGRAVSTTPTNLGGNKDENEIPDTQNVFRVVYFLAKKNGVLSLWSGLSSSLVLVSNPVIQYGLYDVLKDYVIKTRRRSRGAGGGSGGTSSGGTSISPFAAFAIGSFTKTLATLATYPIQVRFVARQKSSSEGSHIMRSRVQCVSTIMSAVTTGRIMIRKKTKNRSVRGMIGKRTVLNCLLVQVAQARMRKLDAETVGGRAGPQAAVGPDATKTTLLRLIVDIGLNEGLTGFFKGIAEKLVQTVSNAALMFALYEAILIRVRVLTERGTIRR